MTTTAQTAPARTAATRGRPRAGEVEGRRERVLAATLELLLEQGYRHTTMSAVARRAGASKESLYSWFGDKEGLLRALIRRQSDEVHERVATAMASGEEPAVVLRGAVVGLLTLLLGPVSLALNRAAIAEVDHAPDLGALLLREGRFRTGPIVEAALARMAADGHLAIEDPADAFGLLYGLAVQDTQIRALLGGPPPDDAEIQRRARHAVDRFLALVAPPPQGRA